MTLQDLIDFHTTGAAACEAFAVTPAAGDAKYKDITKHYTKRTKWHRDAVALLSAQHQGEPVACLTRSRNILTQASIAVDGKDHFSAWSEWAPNSIEYGRAVTDPIRNNPVCYEIELLFKEQSAPVAVKHTMRSVMEAYEAAQKHHLTGTSNFCAAMAAILNGAKP